MRTGTCSHRAVHYRECRAEPNRQSLAVHASHRRRDFFVHLMSRFLSNQVGPAYRLQWKVTSIKRLKLRLLSANTCTAVFETGWIITGTDSRVLLAACTRSRDRFGHSSRSVKDVRSCRARRHTNLREPRSLPPLMRACLEATFGRVGETQAMAEFSPHFPLC